MPDSGERHESNLKWDENSLRLRPSRSDNYVDSTLGILGGSDTGINARFIHISDTAPGPSRNHAIPEVDIEEAKGVTSSNPKKA